MPGFDPPRLGGYTLQNPPNQMVIFPEVVQQVNELADGGHRQRILGYRIRATLLWEDSWIRSQDLTGLALVANDASASLTFVPRTTTFATRTYEVLWINKFNFSFHEGRYDYYAGSIELVSPTIRAPLFFNFSKSDKRSCLASSIFFAKFL